MTPDEKKVYQELRRQSHITAEQKRRGSIKNGFEQLQNLVINPNQHPSGKVSKAVLLEKSESLIARRWREGRGLAEAVIIVTYTLGVVLL